MDDTMGNPRAVRVINADAALAQLMNQWGEGPVARVAVEYIAAARGALDMRDMRARARVALDDLESNKGPGKEANARYLDAAARVTAFGMLIGCMRHAAEGTVPDPTPLYVAVGSAVKG